MSKLELISKDLQKTVEIEVFGYAYQNGDDDDLAILNCNFKYIDKAGIKISFDFELYTYMIVQAAEKYISSKNIGIILGYDNEELTSAFIDLTGNQGRELRLLLTLDENLENQTKLKSNFPLEYIQRENFLKFIFDLMEKYPDRSSHDAYRNSAKKSLEVFRQISSDINTLL